MTILMMAAMGIVHVISVAFIFLVYVPTAHSFLGSKGQSEGFYVHVGPVNCSQALEKVLQVQLKVYEYNLDSVSGRQQMGFLSADIMKVFPEGVEVAATFPLPQKDKTKPPVVLNNYPLVDKSVVFMHSVGAIQAMQHKYDILAAEVQSIVQRATRENPESEFQKKHGKVLLESGWISSDRLATAKRSAQLRRDLADVAIRTTVNASIKRIERALYRMDLRKESRLERQQRLEAYTTEVMSRIADIDLMKRRQLNAIKNITLHQQHSYDVSIVDFDFNDQLIRHNFEISRMMDAVRYKIELMKEAGVEGHALKLMQARSRILREKMLELVDGAFSEVAAFATVAKIEPRVLAFRCAVGLGIVIALTVLYESFVVFRQYVIRKMTMRDSDCARTEADGDNSDSANTAVSCIEDLVVPSHTAFMLHNFCATIKTGCGGSMPLATLLVSGPPGTGKTAIARSVASTCNAVSVFVDGNALQSAGEMAGASFRALFENVRSQLSFNRGLRRIFWPFMRKRPTVIIIDDADALIASRFAAPPGAGLSISVQASSITVNCCLYVLLEAMRESHPDVSVIVATSLPLLKVDTALLDRVDQVVDVQLPSITQRAMFVARLAMQLLSDFVDSDVLAFFETCSEHLKVAQGHGHASNDSNLAVLSFLHSLQSSSQVAAEVLQPISSYSKTLFSAEHCFRDLVVASHQWSLRDLAKFIANVRSEVLGTERCILTSYIWARDLFRQLKDMAILNSRSIGKVGER